MAKKLDQENDFELDDDFENDNLDDYTAEDLAKAKRKKPVVNNDDDDDDDDDALSAFRTVDDDDDFDLDNSDDGIDFNDEAETPSKKNAELTKIQEEMEQLKRELANTRQQTHQNRVQTIKAERQTLATMMNQTATYVQQIDETLENIKKMYIAARQRNDFQAEYDLNERRTAILAERQKAVANFQSYKNHADTLVIPKEEAQAASIGAMAQKWMAKRPFFKPGEIGKDELSTFIDNRSRQLIAAGIDADDPEHYNILDRDIKKKRPDLYAGGPTQRKAATAAGGNSSSGGGSSAAVKKVTRLSDEHRKLGNSIGLNLKDEATRKRYLKNIQEARAKAAKLKKGK